ncbi:MAG: proline dehydrogenase family protein [Actinomycetota bacterium]|nr:proline dehydrogenase family protein [Actinomycetota bacterium]
MRWSDNGHLVDEGVEVIGKTWLWLAEKPRLQRAVTEGRITRHAVNRFIAGDQLEDAIRAIKELNSRGIGGILDLLGEGISDLAGAQAAADEYLASIKRIEETGVDTSVSVKLTQLGLGFDKGACIDHLRRLAAEAEAIGTYVEIDMEQSDHVSDTIDVYRVLRTDFTRLRLAIQAYLRRTPLDLEGLAEVPPRVRLVKGAYSEPPELAFQKRKEIDGQYRFITDWLFEKGSDPAIASHDTKLLMHARDKAVALGLGPESFEIQMLYGIRRELQGELARQGHRVRVYVPFGSAWYPYLMRRIAERPANLKFFLRAVVRD